MKKIILEKWKLVDIGLLVAISILLAYMNIRYEIWFKGPEAYDFYKYYYAIYDPIFSGGKIFTIILGGLVFFPSHIFKKWLFFVLPVPLYVTYYLVEGISVYSSGGVFHISRAQMAENGMIVLAGITIVFVVGHLLYDLKKRK